MKKTSLIVILLITILSLNPVAVAAEEEYRLVIIEEENLQDLIAFTDFLTAKEYFHSVKDNYSNIGVYQGDTLLMVKNGLVLIPNSDCTVNFEYTHVSDNFKGYTNGCYAVDALYLDTSDSGSQIMFELAGVKAWGSAASLTLVPIEEVNQLSSYYVKAGKLYHQIKTNMNSTSYGNTLSLGPAPDYLEEDSIYVSYNGHYFYLRADFGKMVTDGRNNNRVNAVNSNNPYYNYYLLLPHRSQTNHKAEDIVSYFQDELGYQGSITYYVDEDSNSVNDYLTRSQYYDNESSFFEYEGLFGANAMMMLALSMNETASGRSSLAFTRNNLFGHAAYDSDVENNAKRYLNISASVYSHGKNYISGMYANPDKFMYHGSHFGDKSSGMNVAYASDPYWSEKAVQYYIVLDEYFGYPDYNAYALAIKTSSQRVPIYDWDLQTILYYTGTEQNLSFIILADMGSVYKIQLDPAFNSLHESIEYSYDFVTNIGYISKTDIAMVLNSEKISEPQYTTVVYNSKDGYFKNGLTEISLQVKNHKEALFEEPVMDGYLFDKWILTNTSADHIYYEASYKKIESIDITQSPPTVVELDNRISIKGGLLEVKLENQDAYEVEINTSMISGYDINEAGIQEISVQYGGMSTVYQLEVSAELDATRIYLNETAASLVERYDSGGDISALETELAELKSVMASEFYPRLTQANIQKLDALAKELYGEIISVIIHKNEVNLSVSGFYFSTDYSLEKKFFKDTFELKFSKGIAETEKALLEKIALANNYDIDYYFALEISKNGKDLGNSGPFVLTLDLPAESNNRSYQVLQYVDGEVVALHSATYSQTMKFKCFGDGSYVLVSKETNNLYETVDTAGNASYATNGLNYHSLQRWLILAAIAVLLLTAILIIFGLKKRKKKAIANN